MIYALNPHRLSLEASHLGSSQTCSHLEQHRSMESSTRLSSIFNSSLPLAGPSTATAHATRTRIQLLRAKREIRVTSWARRHASKRKKTKTLTQAVWQIRTRIRRPPVGQRRCNDSSSTVPVNGQDRQTWIRGLRLDAATARVSESERHSQGQSLIRRLETVNLRQNTACIMQESGIGLQRNSCMTTAFLDPSQIQTPHRSTPSRRTQP